MKNKQRNTQVYLADTFSHWLGVPREELDMGDIDLEQAMSYLQLAPAPLATRIMRMSVQGLLAHAGERQQIFITDILHRLRRLNAKHPGNIEESFFIKTIGKIKDRLSSRGLDPGRREGLICITHDIDWQGCYDFTQGLSDLEAVYNIDATFNFLSDGNYRLDKGLLRELKAKGAEIGLHGADHDVALAYRSKSMIRDKLRKAMEKISLPVAGFRSPALSTSLTLFEVLDELGFAYESSLYAFSPWGHCAQTCFPYRYPGLKLWEIPLAIQDSALFRDMRLSDKEALKVLSALMQKVLDTGGVFVFCAHPGIIKGHLKFFEEFLEQCKQTAETKSAQVVTMQECYRSFSQAQYRGDR